MPYFLIYLYIDMSEPRSNPQPEPEPESAPPPRILKVRDPPSHKIKPLHPHLPKPPARTVLMVEN